MKRQNFGKNRDRKKNYLMFCFFCVLVILVSCRSDRQKVKDSNKRLENPYFVEKQKRSFKGRVKNERKREIEYISDWDLTSLYDMAGAASTAYLKEVGENYYIFPFVWDLHPNTDGDPTAKEAYITFPEEGINAIFVDVFYISNLQNPAIAVHIVFKDEKQKLTVYQFDQGEEGEKEAPKIFFEFESQGYITLEKKERDSIKIRNDEPIGENIRRIQYHYQGNVFVETVPVILDKKMVLEFPDILNLSSKQNRVNALKGPWVFSKKIAGSLFTPSNFDKAGVVVNFIAKNDRVIFSRNDMAEIFVWRNSSKLLTGVLLSLESLFESRIVQSVMVQFISQDEIELRFRGDMIWSGIYKRMSSAQTHEHLVQQNRLLKNDEFELSGRYSSGQGNEFVFTYPKIIIRTDLENKKVEELVGTYAVFRVNKQNILEIRLLDQNQRFKERKIYLFESNGSVDSQRVVQTFRIIPGNLYTYGVVRMGERPMIFEKISYTDK